MAFFFSNQISSHNILLVNWLFCYQGQMWWTKKPSLSSDMSKTFWWNTLRMTLFRLRNRSQWLEQQEEDRNEFMTKFMQETNEAPILLNQGSMIFKVGVLSCVPFSWWDWLWDRIILIFLLNCECPVHCVQIRWLLIVQTKLATVFFS